MDNPDRLSTLSRIAFKLPTVGENFVFYLAQMSRIAFKLSTIVGEKFEFYLPQMSRIAFILFTMVGENFEFYLAQMSRIAFKLSTRVFVTCYTHTHLASRGLFVLEFLDFVLEMSWNCPGILK